MTETNREQSYYQRLSKKRTPWTMIPEFYGNVKTNLGMGAVFSLVKDFDGEVSKPLQVYLEDPSLEEQDKTILSRQLQTLKRYFVEHSILSMTLKPSNILYQKTGMSEGSLVVVDNLGCADFLPICLFMSFLARRKILRHWNRFESGLWDSYRFG